MTVVCAWCARVLRQGSAGPVSHGCCDDCYARLLEELDAQARKVTVTL